MTTAADPSIHDHVSLFKAAIRSFNCLVVDIVPGLSVGLVAGRKPQSKGRPSHCRELGKALVP